MKTIVRAALISGAFLFYASGSLADQATDRLVKASYALSKPAGDEIRGALREADQENGYDYSRRMEENYADIYDIVTAPDFDRRAFLIKAREIRELRDQAKMNRDEALASALTQLSQKDRLKFAQALENTKPPARKKHKR